MCGSVGSEKVLTLSAILSVASRDVLLETEAESPSYPPMSLFAAASCGLTNQSKRGLPEKSEDVQDCALVDRSEVMASSCSDTCIIAQ